MNKVKKKVLSKDTYFAQISKVCFSSGGIAKLELWISEGLITNSGHCAGCFAVLIYMYAKECLKIGNSGLMSFTASQYAENSLT